MTSLYMVAPIRPGRHRAAGSHHAIGSAQCDKAVLQVQRLIESRQIKAINGGDNDSIEQAFFIEQFSGSAGSSNGG